MICKDCDKRHINCHSTCEEYKAYKAECEIKQIIKQQAYMDDSYFRDKNIRAAEKSLRYKSRLLKRKTSGK